jgi:signal transduction histidine kinase
MKYYFLLAVFILAVLIPCIALSALALRASDKEAMYVERRMEISLLSEVYLMTAEINRLLTATAESLQRDAVEPDWGGNPLVKTKFALSSRYLDVFGEDEVTIAAFKKNFESFLLGNERLLTYELVTRVNVTPASPTVMTRESDAFEEPAAEVPLHTSQQSQISGVAHQISNARLKSDPSAEDKMFSQAESEGFEIYSRNVSPKKLTSPTTQAPVDSVAPESAGAQTQKTPVTLPVQEKRARVNLTKSASLTELSMELTDAPDTTHAFRSKTVSKYRSFGEVASESSYGLLPKVTEGGLELLFWTKVSGQFVGCSLRMDTLKDMIADVMPDVISDARILTVLDESGEPIIYPGDLGISTDWANPLLAREISPLLPRWEAATWLIDPGSLESRANFARLLAWIQVVALGLVIIAGSTIVLRIISYEMRIASQRTTFVTNVSHELKTPLTSIRLYAELLSSGRQIDEARCRVYLRTINSEAERLSNLVDNVLTFSRLGRKANDDMKLEPISLVDLTLDTVSQIEPHLEKLGFSVKYDRVGFHEKLPIMGDREALKQVLVNLLSNAEKYSGESREITIEFGHAEQKEHKINVAEVRVLDRGIGVRNNMSKKIFDEFVRGDDSLSAPAGGTGLGLFIARDIARKHGGDVTFSHRNGGGSVFTLILPLTLDSR